MRFSQAVLGCSLLALAAAGPVNVNVTLRGKKYQVNGASVGEIQAEMEKVAGLHKGQQSVLYKGKLLSSDDDLAAAGVTDGDTINVVPSKRPKSERSAPASSGSGGGAVESGSGGFPGLEGLGGGLGGMGGLPGMPPGMADMSQEEYQKMMGEVLNSPMMDEFFGSPEKIEESRKAILENPMLKQAMGQLPGFSEMLEDADKWQESMLQAKEMMEAQRTMLQKQNDTGGAPFGGDVDDLDDE